jgi:hypothetical protein
MLCTMISNNRRALRYADISYLEHYLELLSLAFFCKYLLMTMFYNFRMVCKVLITLHISKPSFSLQGWMMGETLLNPGDSRLCV